MSNHQERLRDPYRERPTLVPTGVSLKPLQGPALDNPLREGFRLSDWQVHPIDGSLTGAQGPTHLEPKVMEVLVLLASNPGQLVEREFLIREIWGTRTVSDEPLTRCIAILRRTLGDSAKHPRCIQTVPKRGYRLVAEVDSLCGSRPRLPSAPVEADACAFPLGNQYLRHGTATLGGSIAALPFENLSPDPDNIFFADGVQDDLLNQLAKIDSLTVISRTSVRKYRDSPKNLRNIGQELGAAAIVEGGVRRVGDTVRVNVNLIDAQTDQYLWAETYERRITPENVFAIQSELAAQIANSLQAELSRQGVCRSRTRLGTQTSPRKSGITTTCSAFRSNAS